MTDLITREDLLPFAPDISEAKATAMIEDVTARAQRIAPCLGDPELDADKRAAAKAVLRDVILRWNDQGSGAITHRTVQAGPFQQSETTDSSRSKPRFWPSEIKELQDLCREHTSQKGKAFSIDLAGGAATRTLIQLQDGSIVDLAQRPDLWLEYGAP